MKHGRSAGSPDLGPGFRRFGIPLEDTQEMPVVPDLRPRRRLGHLAPFVAVAILGTAIGLTLPTGAPDAVPVPPSSSTASARPRTTGAVRLTERPESPSLPDTRRTEVQSTRAPRTAPLTAIRRTAQATPTPSRRSKSSTPSPSPSGKPTKTGATDITTSTITTTVTEGS